MSVQRTSILLLRFQVFNIGKLERATFGEEVISILQLAGVFVCLLLLFARLPLHFANLHKGG